MNRLTLDSSRLFSFFKLLNLFCKSAMLSKPSLSPLLSYTTLSKKVLKILWRSRSSSLSLRILSLSASLSFRSLMSCFFFSMSAFSSSSFLDSAFLLRAFALSWFFLLSISSMVLLDSSLWRYLWASTSLALAMISSFCLWKLSSVSRSSLSFWRSRTAWRGLVLWTT